MPVKRYKLALPTSSQKIRKAKATLKRIDLMVKAGSMTEKQAEKTRKKLAETSV